LVVLVLGAGCWCSIRRLLERRQSSSSINQSTIIHLILSAATQRFSLLQSRYNNNDASWLW
jgi:hypothetical protein